jgi:hypothetical protein
MSTLPYKVECKSIYPFFEVIAAFNVESAAESYALECYAINSEYTYRVKKHLNVLHFYGVSA